MIDDYEDGELVGCNETDTSTQAARDLEGGFARGLRRAIEEYIRSRGVYGATNDEVSVALNIYPGTVSARTAELRHGVRTRTDGLIERGPARIFNSGKRRESRRGKNQIVYVHNEFKPPGFGIVHQLMADRAVSDL